MDSAKLNDWMQVIGIFALVASLIFVGMQMRLDREIARVMIYQSRASTTAEVLATLASSPDAMAASVKSLSGDPITGQDMMLGSFQFGSVFAPRFQAFVDDLIVAGVTNENLEQLYNLPDRE